MIALLIAAGLVGGAVNAAAGGAKLFVFPLLLAAGLPPLVANATGTVAVWPAQAPAAWVYRDRLARGGRRALLLEMAPALAGALVGALALIFSGEKLFTQLVPFCLVIAVVAIAFGDRLAAWARRVAGSGAGPISAALFFLCGAYAGFFGAGMGFMLMATLALAGVADPHDANARKNLYAVAMNTTAVVPLGLSGLVQWPEAALVAVGGIVGGFLGARLVRRLPPKPMRWFVAIAGGLMTVAFLAR